ncbi:MAG TPA: phospholipase D-like domain-containing protein [Candidatus Acidoferrales bacterium]|nr:phospholipase D-like domain-containing protein [Candidatus Acidoferrales bacterium]
MQLVGLPDVVAAIDRAKCIKLDAYVLGRGTVFHALERAADRGADVSVDLCDSPAGNDDAKSWALSITKELREHGIRVVTEPGVGLGSTHAKVALIDDRVFYDDRNWRSSGGDDAILATDVDEALPLRSKGDVIAEEAALIRSGEGHEILVATESFGPGPIAKALLERAQRGDDVRLIYNAAEPTRGRDDTLAALQNAGVRIEQSNENHKLACVGNRVWIGSANATVTGGDTGAGREWGVELHGALAAKVEARAEDLWHEAHSPVYGHPGA